MRRWIAAAVGLFGLVAYLRRRRRAAPAHVEPAEELRSKLAESRAVPEPDPVPEPVEDAAPDELGERRQDVHDRARSAIDELG